MLQHKLLDTAIEHFGRLGFDGASTRAIASASGTAMSSITYHYGGKEGLYLAAADHIADNILGHIGPVFADHPDPEDATPEEAETMLLAMLDRFATMLLDPASEAWAQFIIREQQHPTEAFERLFGGGIGVVVEKVIALVRRIRPELSDLDCRLMAVFLWGQTIVLRAGRASVERFLGRSLRESDTCRQLRERLRANALFILNRKDPST